MNIVTISPLRPAAPPPDGLRSGFTLIELLVVIGLIVLLAAGIGFSLGDTGGNSLANAQKILASLVSSARAQAAVHQTRARLYIYGTRPPTGDAEKFLRLLQVFDEDPAQPGIFQPVGAAVYLPRGIYVVPSSTAGLLAQGVIWPTNPAPLSTFVSTAPQAITPGPVAGTPFFGATAFYVEFGPEGTVAPAQPAAKLVVATAAISNNLPQFTNAGAIRGVLVRPTGAITFANDPTNF